MTQTDIRDDLQKIYWKLSKLYGQQPTIKEEIQDITDDIIYLIQLTTPEQETKYDRDNQLLSSFEF